MTAPHNPYWDAVKPHLGTGVTGGPAITWLTADPLIRRFDVVGEYAWTVTDPATLAFVADHAGPDVIDPLAGSGYWAYLLEQVGCTTAAYDLNPPTGGGNQWHKAGVEHCRVLQGNAVDVVTVYSEQRTLLLSWPPYAVPLGADILAAYTGRRVIYIGEPEGGCCGDDDMFAAFRNGWREVAEHRPIQWDGIHDYVTVYDRT